MGLFPQRQTPPADAGVIKEAAERLTVLYRNMGHLATTAHREHERLREQLNRCVPRSDVERAIVEVLRHCPGPMAFDVIRSDSIALARVAEQSVRDHAEVEHFVHDCGHEELFA